MAGIESGAAGQIAVKHVVEATAPDRLTQSLLDVGANEPCLLLHRRTWSGAHVAAYAWLLHPASRYRLSAQFPVGE